MQFPIDIRFKILALTGKITATVPDGRTAFFVKQKIALKENIEVYTDNTQTNKMFTVRADRVIDFSPEFIIYDLQERPLASLKRHGKGSIWKAHYEININNMIITVRESNPWVKVMDAILSEIPLVGIFSGYFFHPRYSITTADGIEIASLTKNAAFLESSYTLDYPNPTLDDYTQLIFSVLIMTVTLRERVRG